MGWERYPKAELTGPFTPKWSWLQLISSRFFGINSIAMMFNFDLLAFVERVQRLLFRSRAHSRDNVNRLTCRNCFCWPKIVTTDIDLLHFLLYLLKEEPTTSAFILHTIILLYKSFSVWAEPNKCLIKNSWSRFQNIVKLILISPESCQGVLCRTWWPMNCQICKFFGCSEIHVFWI